VLSSSTAPSRQQRLGSFWSAVDVRQQAAGSVVVRVVPGIQPGDQILGNHKAVTAFVGTQDSEQHAAA
jgi:hypothetical protein